MHHAHAPRLEINDDEIGSGLHDDISLCVTGWTVKRLVCPHVGIVRQVRWNGIDRIGASHASDIGHGVEDLFRRFGVDALSVLIVRGNVSFVRPEA